MEVSQVLQSMLSQSFREMDFLHIPIGNNKLRHNLTEEILKEKANEIYL
jgi:hypothetical protein